MNTNINSSECAWHESEVIILGCAIKGLRGFEFKKTVEKKPVYGAGQYMLGIEEGKIEVTGNLTVLGFELDKLNKTAQAAGYKDITEVPYWGITITASFIPRHSGLKTFVTTKGVAFTGFSHTMQQNAKMREVQLPFVAMDMEMKFN